MFTEVPDMSVKCIKHDAALLRYCELDTLAMVEVWKKLIELSKN